MEYHFFMFFMTPNFQSVMKAMKNIQLTEILEYNVSRKLEVQPYILAEENIQVHCNSMLIFCIIQRLKNRTLTNPEVCIIHIWLGNVCIWNNYPR